MSQRHFDIEARGLVLVLIHVAGTGMETLTSAFVRLWTSTEGLTLQALTMARR